MLIGIVGLGYVGFPLMCALADRGVEVVGYDISSGKVGAISDGESPLPDEDSEGLLPMLRRGLKSGMIKVTLDPSHLKNCDVITINVPTPVLQDGNQSLLEIQSAVSAIAPHLKRGVIVLVESTVAPGTTTDQVLRPIEKTRNWIESEDFYVAMSPERVMPGKALKNLSSIPRVCGVTCSAAQRRLGEYFEQLGVGEVDFVSLLTAETVKVVENTYRDVQIAFANEIAGVCAELNVDVHELRRLVNKVPERNMHIPGGGVGGHCIPKDSLLLASKVLRPLHLVRAARKVNEARPYELADRVLQRLVERSEVRREIDVCILGYSYLPSSGDVRNSPSEVVVLELQRRGVTTVIHDPYVALYSNDFEAKIRSATVVLKMVDHPQYVGVDEGVECLILAHEFPVLMEDGRS